MTNRLHASLSQYFDGELSADERSEVERLLEESTDARDYIDTLQLFRKNLRYEEASGLDVTAAVFAELSAGPRPLRLRVGWATAFAAGVVAGAVFIGLTISQPSPIAAADVPTRVLSAQSEVASLSASLTIVERGWHPDIAERTFSGRLEYRAPEMMWIELTDDTLYPSAEWIPSHSTVVVDESVTWTSSISACPTKVLPACTPSDPRVTVMNNREPFPDRGAAPLDLVVPTASFSRAADPLLIGYRDLDGRRAIGIEVTAAQMAPLLERLMTTGNWRKIHPTDRVELWLDTEVLTPLALSVYSVDTPERNLWAIRHGYSDTLGVAILEVTWSDVDITQNEAVTPPPTPADAVVINAGFHENNSTTFGPIDIPEGLEPHRGGTIVTDGGPAVSVASWSDGRAWLKVRWTDDWGGQRLFGDLGLLVREIELDDGVAYINELGDRIAIHAANRDLVVVGSLPTDVLVAVAESLEIESLVVPADWRESATATVEGAMRSVPQLLMPADLTGFAEPSIRIESNVVILSFAGAGSRLFLLTQTQGSSLSPPLEANVRGVTVRGFDGRYSPNRGLLEWVEDARVMSLGSETMTVDELVDIAATLSRP